MSLLDMTLDQAYEEGRRAGLTEALEIADRCGKTPIIVIGAIKELVDAIPPLGDLAK